MAEIELRPYQENFISNLRAAFRKGYRRVIGVAPCGAGKTIMTGWMIKESLKKGFRSVFIVHRKELIDQTAEAFERLHLPFGVIASGCKPIYELPVQIASVQTLINRLEDLPEPDFIICDECHHIMANTYRQIIGYWEKAALLGVTATPVRLNQKEKLKKIFRKIVVGASTPELIVSGSLTPATTFHIPCQLELDEIPDDMGDYDKHVLSKLMAKPDFCEKIVVEYLKRAADKKAIAYCVDVAHSKLLAETFCKFGVNAIQCDGATPKKQRQEIIEGFRNGKYQVLCNAELFGEGFDVPDCHAVILARPTKSLGLYIQQAMRPMRPDPQDPCKVAMVFDFVGNYSRFGNIEDDRNEFWIEEFYKEPKNGKGEMPLKTCPVCHGDVPISTLVCGGKLDEARVKEIQEETAWEFSFDAFGTLARAELLILLLENQEKLKAEEKKEKDPIAEERRTLLIRLKIAIMMYRDTAGRYNLDADALEHQGNIFKDLYSRLKISRAGGCGHCFNECTECHASVPFKAVNCPECGAEVLAERLDAEGMVEAEVTRKNSSPFEKILENIIRVCQKNNYKKGWIFYRLKDFAKTFEDYLYAAVRLGIEKAQAWAGYQIMEKVTTFDELKEIEFKAGFKSGWAYVQAKKLGIAIP